MPTPVESQILVAEDLKKSYGTTVALRGLSFSLKAGRVLGLLGPNGAGKTTAIRILTTILDPSSGRFFVDGISSEYPHQIRRKIGVLPESLGFPKKWSGIEYLVYFGQHYGLNAGEAERIARSLLTEVGLRERSQSLIGTYSRGMRQRLGIARALINAPRVVFLDEPTLGLDPRGQQELLSMIERIANERNAGVVLCSHVLSEIEAACDEVIILRSGEAVAKGSVDEVIGQVQRDVKRQNIHRVQVPTQFVRQAADVLQAAKGVISTAIGDESSGWLAVEAKQFSDAIPRGEVNNKILSALIRAEIPVLSFSSQNGRLQDVFLQLTDEARHGK